MLLLRVSTRNKGVFLAVFNLIMKRKPFAVTQTICDIYETNFKEKVATASVVNVLIAEALTARGLIPKDYILKEYGSNDPIKEGFTASARGSILTVTQVKAQADLDRESRFFEAIFKTEWETHKDKSWRDKILARAAKYPEIEFARLLLELNKT